MGRSALPSTLHIGSITVETRDLYVAREVAAVIQAMPASSATEGLLLLDGRQIRWWRIPSNPIPSHIAKKQGAVR